MCRCFIEISRGVHIWKLEQFCYLWLYFGKVLSFTFRSSIFNKSISSSFIFNVEKITEFLNNLYFHFTK